jgi:type II secretory pathway pseudopilin PulG
MNYQSHHQGYSLVEVLVAVALLMFAIVGPMTIAVKASQSAQYARQQNTAFFLAQEGVSIVNKLRNDGGLKKVLGTETDAWAWLDHAALAPCKASYGCNMDMVDANPLDNVTSCQNETDCTLDFRDTTARGSYQVGEGDASSYRRIIFLEEISADEVTVRTEVRWESGLFKDTRTVSISTSLFNMFK